MFMTRKSSEMLADKIKKDHKVCVCVCVVCVKGHWITLQHHNYDNESPNACRYTQILVGLLNQLGKA